MARPKKSSTNELSAVEKAVVVQEAKLKKLREKQKRLQEADNIRLGKLIKTVFKDMLPETADEQVIFFTELAKHANMSDNMVKSESREETVREEVSHVEQPQPVLQQQTYLIQDSDRLSDELK